MAEDQRKMAADQARIGNLQVRPWLLLDESSIESNHVEFEVTLEFTNCGATPAANITVHCLVEGYNFINDQDGNFVENIEYFFNLPTKRRGALSPNRPVIITHKIPRRYVDFNKHNNRVCVSWNYSSHEGYTREIREAIIEIGMASGKVIIRYSND